MSIEKDLLFMSLVVPALCFYLNRLLAEKRELAKQCEIFAGMLAHDLKVSVLAELRGLYLLKGNNSSPCELVAEITRSCEYTLDMITTVLAAYKAKRGSFKPYYEVFNLSEAVPEIFYKLSAQADKKGIDFCCAADEIFVNADKESILTVISILVNFAILYSGKNKIIYCFIDRVQNAVKVMIIFSGRGFSQIGDKDIFGRNNRYGFVGQNLKLAYCRKIVECHGGKISAASNGGDINSFTFVLPDKVKDRIAINQTASVSR